MFICNMNEVSMFVSVTHPDSCLYIRLLSSIARRCNNKVQRGTHDKFTHYDLHSKFVCIIMSGDYGCQNLCCLSLFSPRIWKARSDIIMPERLCVQLMHFHLHSICLCYNVLAFVRSYAFSLYPVFVFEKQGVILQFKKEYVFSLYSFTVHHLSDCSVSDFTVVSPYVALSLHLLKGEM